eukprot:7594103-Pyramimonas_sp.AAC.1
MNPRAKVKERGRKRETEREKREYVKSPWRKPSPASSKILYNAGTYSIFWRVILGLPLQAGADAGL